MRKTSLLSISLTFKIQAGCSILQTVNSLSLCVVCWYILQTVWTQIRPDKMSGLFWIQSVCQGIPEWIFWKCWFWKKSADNKKSMKNFPGGKELPWYNIKNYFLLMIKRKLYIRYLLQIFKFNFQYAWSSQFMSTPTGTAKLSSGMLSSCLQSIWREKDVSIRVQDNSLLLLISNDIKFIFVNKQKRLMPVVIFMSNRTEPQLKWGKWGAYCFRCGSRRPSRSFFTIRYLLNQLMDFDQTCKDIFLGGGTSWLDFGDLDLIFKVTPALWNVQNRVSVRYLLNQLMDFDQTCIDTLLGGT